MGVAVRLGFAPIRAEAQGGRGSASKQSCDVEALIAPCRL